MIVNKYSNGGGGGGATGGDYKVVAEQPSTGSLGQKIYIKAQGTKTLPAYEFSYDGLSEGWKAIRFADSVNTLNLDFYLRGSGELCYNDWKSYPNQWVLKGAQKGGLDYPYVEKYCYNDVDNKKLYVAYVISEGELTIRETGFEYIGETTASVSGVFADTQELYFGGKWHKDFYPQDMSRAELGELFEYLYYTPKNFENINVWYRNGNFGVPYVKATAFGAEQNMCTFTFFSAYGGNKVANFRIKKNGDNYEYDVLDAALVENNATIVNLDTTGTFVNADGGTLADNAKESLFWNLYRTIQDGLDSDNNKNTKVMFQLNKNCVDESIRNMWERNYSVINSLREGNDTDLYISAFVDAPDGTYLGKWKMRYYYDEGLQRGVVSFDILKWQKID